MVCACPCFHQAAHNEPVKQEIAEAYGSKIEKRHLPPASAVGAMAHPRNRGCSLHFQRASERRGVELLTREYREVDKKNGACAQYRISDTIPLPPVNVQINRA
jgi:hypothetical protein